MSIRMSLALQGVKEYCEKVDRLDVEYAQLRQEAVADRNEAIIDALEAGYPIAKLARVTGLSRTRIYQIRDNEDSTKR